MQPDYGLGSNSLAAMLQMQGLPPLPRSLTGYLPSSGGPPPGSSSQVPTSYGFSQSVNHPLYVNHGSGLGHHHQGLKTPYSIHPQLHSRQGLPLPPPPPAPAPPPRPHSRRSSSSGSSFRASPEHTTNRTTVIGPTDGVRCSPRSISSSPSVIDSGLGRSSVETDSFSEPRAFVRVIKSPPIIPTRLDAQLNQLRKDMIHLRQQDMALLGHLLQIHQGIQDLRNVLVQPPHPAPMTGPLPMFQTTGYFQSSSGSGSGSTSSSSRHSKNSKGHHHSFGQSKLSMLSSGASKLFSRRSSTDKLMAEAMNYEVGGISHNPASRNSLGLMRRRDRERGDDESDSLSSFEFGDN